MALYIMIDSVAKKVKIAPLRIMSLATECLEYVNERDGMKFGMVEECGLYGRLIGQNHAEGSTSRSVVFGVDRSAMLFGDFAADGKSETSPSCTRFGSCALTEFLKDLIELILGYAYTLIGNRDFQTIDVLIRHKHIFRFNLNLDLLSLWCELDTV